MSKIGQANILKLLNKTGVDSLLNKLKSFDDSGRRLILDSINTTLTNTQKQLVMAELKRHADATNKEVADWLTKSISMTYVDSMNESVKLASLELKQQGTVLYKWSGGVKGAQWQALEGNRPDPFNFGVGFSYSLDPVSSSDFGDTLTTGLLPKKYKLVDVKMLVPVKDRNLPPEDILARAGIRAQAEGKTILEKAREMGYDGVVYPSNINDGQWVIVDETVAKTALKRIIPNVPKITVELLKSSAPLAPHLAAVNALLSDAYLDFGKTMTSYMAGAERILNDATKRQIRTDMIAGRLEGADLRTIKNVVKETIGSQGFTVLQDRGGREWSLDAYGKMLVKTHLMKANNEGAINRASDFDVDIVEISTHGATDDLCAPEEGEIYSISGDSKDYPSLDGHEPPYHPNCGHTILYRPDLQNDLTTETKSQSQDDSIDEQTINIGGKDMTLADMHSAAGTELFKSLSKSEQDTFSKFDREQSLLLNIAQAKAKGKDTSDLEAMLKLSRNG